MTALDLFQRLAALIPPAVEAEFHRTDCCILATRLAIEAAAYFRIPAVPVAVQVVLLNQTFARHVDAGECDIAHWAAVDGSHSVGIGCGFHDDEQRDGRWDGHLIAVADGYFGDFAIQQAERPAKGIVTGPAVIGPLHNLDMWGAINDGGTVIQYRRVDDTCYRRAPDWTDQKRRRKLAGPIIRAVRSW
jgi:hypothetical protein